MRTFEEALKKAILGPYLRQLQSPKAPSTAQLAQGPLGVGGAPHGSPQGMWGELFGNLTPQAQLQTLQDDLIRDLHL